MQNAVRHNVEGGTIEVELTQHQFRIRNHGKQPEGAPEDYFERFKKDNQSSKSLGLGLSIVQRLQALLGLNLSMESKEGEGTQFKMWLPKSPN